MQMQTAQGDGDDLDEAEKKAAGRDILRAAGGGIPGQGRPDSLPDLPPPTISP